jgi:hypothetical protein
MSLCVDVLIGKAASSFGKCGDDGQEATDFAKLMPSAGGAPTVVAQASGLAGGPQMLDHLGRLTDAARQAIFGKPGWIDGQRHLDAHIHYMKGTGAPMNVDLNALNFDHVKATDFPAVADALKANKGHSGPVTVTLPGSHAVVTPGGADAVWAGRVVADLAPGAKLTIQPDGDYKLDGQISVRSDLYNFDPGTGRKSPFAEASTWVGLLGSDTPLNRPREYMMHFVGTQNFDRNVVVHTGMESGRLHPKK